MTADRRAALLLKMNDVYWAAEEGTKVTPLDRMSSVLDLIRAEVLEEAASSAFLRPLVEEQAKGEWDDKTIDEDVAMFAAAIRALKEAPCSSS
jgi:hypothetical protein